MKRAMVIGAVIILTLLTPSILVGWGTEGHEIVASLAESRLTASAKRGIRSLIGDASLASVANWADEVRPERDETYNWHFVDIPESALGFSDERDCFLPNNSHKGAATDHHNCVVDRIELFQQVLSDGNASRDDRIEALKFLVHFVGDVHQPFHAIGEAAGGNRIAVTEFGSTQCGRHPCNLHGAWDSGLIQHTGMRRDEYVAHLEKLISDEHLTASGNPEDWANESHGYAQSAWLADGTDQDDIGYEKVPIASSYLLPYEVVPHFDVPVLTHLQSLGAREDAAPDRESTVAIGPVVSPSEHSILSSFARKGSLRLSIPAKAHGGRAHSWPL